MNRLAWFTPALIFMEQVADPAYAVVPPVTSLEAPSTSMSPFDCLLYGSVIILLGALFIAALALIVRLIKALFER